MLVLVEVGEEALQPLVLGHARHDVVDISAMES
jgi:hypothetical protein